MTVWGFGKDSNGQETLFQTFLMWLTLLAWGYNRTVVLSDNMPPKERPSGKEDENILTEEDFHFEDGEAQRKLAGKINDIKRLSNNGFFSNILSAESEERARQAECRALAAEAQAAQVLAQEFWFFILRISCSREKSLLRDWKL